MLDNVITLPVDVANDTTLVETDFSRFDEYNSRTVYISENHLPDSRDLLTFYRTFPKPAGTFKGVRKTAVKFTQDTEVENSVGETIAAPSIVEVSFSLPVGVTAAKATELRQRVIALLDNDTIMNKLNLVQSI